MWHLLIFVEDQLNKNHQFMLQINFHKCQVLLHFTLYKKIHETKCFIGTFKVLTFKQYLFDLFATNLPKMRQSRELNIEITMHRFFLLSIQFACFFTEFTSDVPNIH